MAKQVPVVNAHFYWEQFINKGELFENKLRPMVAASWRRCAAYKVDPFDGRSHYILPANELRLLHNSKNQVL